MASSPTAQPTGRLSIRWRNQWWVVAAFGLLVWAIQVRQTWFLNFVHVFSAVLWTGTDLFMGFMVGPILSRLDVAARRDFMARLIPRMLFYMPTIAIIGGTSGWFLASRLGFLALPYPQRWWVIAALLILVLLTVQGLGILLPTNLRMYFEMNKPAPDIRRMQGWMRRYVRIVALQGLFQVVIVAIMAKFATGI